MSATPPRDRLLEIFFLPPMAIARCGGSPTPADSFRWEARSMLRDSPGTVIEPDVSLLVRRDGSVRPVRRSRIVLRDGEGGPIRPVAPFFELWGKFQRSDGGGIDERPLTSQFLAAQGVELSNVIYEVNVANRKVERRTGNPSDSFVSRVVVNGADHERRPLNAFSPHTSGQEPLVFEERPIPLGHFQVLRPVPRKVSVPLKDGPQLVDCDILRVRFTPPKGLVYGPAAATSGPAQRVPTGTYEDPRTLWGRIHRIVPPQRRILNGNSAWTRYIMMNGSHEDPPPQDGYDGATVGNHQSWGCADDTSDGILQATMVLDGRLYRAAARVFVGPPDFAPDRRPIYSVADDIADREFPAVSVDPESLEATTAEVLDLFHRAFDAASLFNLDAERARALVENNNRIRNAPPDAVVPQAPDVRGGSMTAADRDYVDKVPVLAPMPGPSWYSEATPNGPLPYSEAVPFVHGQLKSEPILVDFLRRRPDLVRRIVRPPFADFAQLPEQAAATPDGRFRDPRVLGDRLHDMRMPPYMRDASLHPLSLSRRQYKELMEFVDALGKAPGGPERQAPEAAADAGKPEEFARRIYPRNLTARAALAARRVTGNPATTRLESAVGNCFPGLEFDVRELDRRFFPGLVFQFVQPPRDEYTLPEAPKNQQGAHLLYADWTYDPMLREDSGEKWVQDLLDAYRRSPGGSLMTRGRWYLDWIERNGKRVSMSPPAGGFYDGYTVWRIVRHLEPGMLTIGLVDRDDPAKKLQFTGERRKFLNAAGMFDESYKPGELTESMCNPWTHDFRDCGCHYWATNHPDVVTRREAEDVDEHGRPTDPASTSLLVNWIRVRETAAGVPAFDTFMKNRPYELDHYQINEAWEKLPFVLEGREVGAEYEPPVLAEHAPYPGGLDEMRRHLREELGPMELGLAMQYLYALFSLRDPAEIGDEEHRRWPALRADLKAVRQQVLLIAVSEMTHLRWVNQMLWMLEGEAYEPVVDWTDEYSVLARIAATTRLGLSPLTPERVAEFAFVERPGGRLSSAYDTCVATLEGRPELRHVLDVALRIDGEGIDHHERFRNIERILGAYGKQGQGYPFLRDVTETENAGTREALDLFDRIREGVAAAYAEEARKGGGDADGVQRRIASAREAMLAFRTKCEALAREGYGVPLLKSRRTLRT